MPYLTDGLNLYEVVAEQAVRNYGLVGGFIRTLVVRDCRTDEDRVMGSLEEALCTPVGSYAAL